jgi:hypothetical protein
MNCGNRSHASSSRQRRGGARARPPPPTPKQKNTRALAIRVQQSKAPPPASLDAVATTPHAPHAISRARSSNRGLVHLHSRHATCLASWLAGTLFFFSSLLRIVVGRGLGVAGNGEPGCVVGRIRGTGAGIVAWFGGAFATLWGGVVFLVSGFRFSGS